MSSQTVPLKEKKKSELNEQTIQIYRRFQTTLTSELHDRSIVIGYLTEPEIERV